MKDDQRSSLKFTKVTLTVDKVAAFVDVMHG